MRCFCPDVRNEDDLLTLLNQGQWDKRIFEYLIDIMSENENKVLGYDPIELFELQANMRDEHEVLYLQFWNKSESGIYKDGKYSLSEKQNEFFDLFVIRIREIHEVLKKLENNS